jgi:elongation factor Ts
VAKDVAMQVAAMNPLAVTAEGIPAEVKEKELSIAREKAREAGKKTGKVCWTGSPKALCRSSTRNPRLLQQEYVKDPKKSIEQYLKEQDKELSVESFKRVSLNA